MMLIVVILVVFVMMEGVAWAMHKYVMHGLFWNLHKDHHRKEPQRHGFFELNDFFFVFFALLSIITFALWTYFGGMVLAGIGAGICLYGATYFLIHDIFIHQRIRFLRRTNNRYLKAIRRAHKVHHKRLKKEGGECFGMLWVPIAYFREA